MRDCSRQLARILLCVTVIASLFNPQVTSLASLPPQISMVSGDRGEIDLGMSRCLMVRVDDEEAAEFPGSTKRGGWLVPASASLSVVPTAAGRFKVDVWLFGLVPMKSFTVTVLPPIQVVPGGQSIGIVVNSRGLVVVDLWPRGGDCPARDAGVRPGDIILSVEGQKVLDEASLNAAVERKAAEGKPVALEVLREGHSEPFSVEVDPARGPDGRHHLGIRVRGGTAGVGTLSFYVEESGVFMALGHVVTDPNSGQPVKIADGYIASATVAGVQQAKRGAPGEKIGAFLGDDSILGRIERNTDLGIVGKLRTFPENPLFGRPIPIALAGQVREGPAEIVTVISGNDIEKFRVEILRVNPQATDRKGLILKVTDGELISRTGGIVQGMSGSPVIQDGKMVGVLTHVLVNDPTRGYGTFAEWMIIELEEHLSRTDAHEKEAVSALSIKGGLKVGS